MTRRPGSSFLFSYYSRLIVGCLFLMLAFSNLYGQDYWKEQRISVEQGLSNRFVRSVTQDSRGLTWISTNFGLNRYDGHQMNVMTKESHGLQSNIIQEIFPDPNQFLWLVERDEPGHCKDVGGNIHVF